MFKKTMSLLSSAKTYSEQEAAEELGVSTETLRSFIDYLAEKGVLSQVKTGPNQPSCNKHSSACVGCKGCSVKPFLSQAPVLWELKEKSK